MAAPSSSTAERCHPADDRLRHHHQGLQRLRPLRLRLRGQVDLSIDHAKLPATPTPSATASAASAAGARCALNSDQLLGGEPVPAPRRVVDNTSVGDQGAGGVSALHQPRRHRRRCTPVRTLFQGNASGARGSAARSACGPPATPVRPPSTSESQHFVRTRPAARRDAGSRSGRSAPRATPSLSDSRSTYRRNRAIGDGAYGGGGLQQRERSSRFTGSVFTGNSSGPATGGDGHGGAVFADDHSGLPPSPRDDDRTTAPPPSAVASTPVSTPIRSRSRVHHRRQPAGNRGTHGRRRRHLRLRRRADGGELHHRAQPGARRRTATEGASTATAASSACATAPCSTTSGATAAASTPYTAGGDLLGSIVTGNHRSPGGAEQDCRPRRSRETALRGWQPPRPADLRHRDHRPATRSRHRPRLGRLQDNGGPTRTMALAAKSPAIGRGTFQCPRPTSADATGRRTTATPAPSSCPGSRSTTTSLTSSPQLTTERTQP